MEDDVPEEGLENEIDGGISVDDISSDSDEEEQEKAQSYNELLQLLNTGSDSKGPARKRRKLGHKDSDKHEEVRNDTVSEQGGDEEIPEEDNLQDQEPSDDEDEENLGEGVNNAAEEEYDDDDYEDGNCCLFIFSRPCSFPSKNTR